MANYTAEQQETILVQMGRRRRNEALLLAAMVICTLLVIFARRAPGQRLGGLSFDQLAGIDTLVISAGFLLHRRNWRCAGCGAYLGRKIEAAACLRCGAVLIAASSRAPAVGAPPPPRAGAPQPAAELALQREVGFYKAQTAKWMSSVYISFLFAVIILCAGVIGVLNEDRSTAKTMFTLGGAMVVLCVIFRINIGRRMTPAAYEEKLRGKMGLPPADRGGAA